VAARTRDGVAGTLKWTVTAAAAVLTGVFAILTWSKRDRRIRYTYDPESNNWSFEVPSLGIVGGAETRAEAERQAVEAIDFTERHNRSATA
jgi:predicted RNase H-like HicB family nuclease